MLLKPIKENGSKQRNDTILNLSVAYAIRDYVFSGGKLNPKQGYFYVCVDLGSEKRPIKISVPTYYSWLRRGNIIPETGQTLKSFITEVFAEYRIEKNVNKIEQIADRAEEALFELVKLDTRVPLRNRLGQEVVDEVTGKVVMVEDANLLKVQMDTAMFILERLDRENYGKYVYKQPKREPVCLADLVKENRSKITGLKS
jgi:hypothetical protein